jgi:hypothetical protein
VASGQNRTRARRTGGASSSSTAPSRNPIRPVIGCWMCVCAANPSVPDNASILLEDLGLTSQQLRLHLKARAKFLRAKDRVDRLKKWVAPNDDADDLDRKMIGVLVKADQPELPAILLRLFPALLQDGVVESGCRFQAMGGCRRQRSGGSLLVCWSHARRDTAMPRRRSVISCSGFW